VQDRGYSNNNDYTGLASQAIAFAAGQTQATVNVHINDLGLTSGSETFRFIVQQNASDPVTTSLASDAFTVDNTVSATPAWTITTNPNPVNENAGSAIVTVTRSSASGSQTVYVSTVNGAEGYSVNAGDYAANVDNLPVTFAPGVTSQSIALGVNDLGLTSGSKTFGLLVQSSATPSLTADVLATGALTIADDDSSASSTAYAVTANPNPVNDTAETLYASTVNATEGYSVNNGDYATSILNLPVAFAAGATPQTVTVTVTKQTLSEPDATFGFILQRNASDPVSTSLASTNWTFHDTVTGPPIQYSVSANPDPAVENGQPITFTITRSGSNLPAQTLNASTVDGTENIEYAVNPGEFANINFQPVVFAAGAASATVTLPLLNDSASETNKNFGFFVTSDTNLSDYITGTNCTVEGTNSISAPKQVATGGHIYGFDTSVLATTASAQLIAGNPMNGLGENQQFAAQYLGEDLSAASAQDIPATLAAGAKGPIRTVSIYENAYMSIYNKQVGPTAWEQYFGVQVGNSSLERSPSEMNRGDSRIRSVCDS
jgi:hypothetical protein